MQYAKLIHDYPSFAPRRMRIGDMWVYNPTGAQLLAEGYLPVIETTPTTPPEGYYMESHWEEKDGQIVQEWEAVEKPVSDEATAEDYEAALREVGVSFDEEN